MTLARSRRLVRRNGPELEELAITPRQIERWTHEGYLSRIQPRGRYAPALVDLEEVWGLLDAGTTPATADPIGDVRCGLLATTTALADKYDRHPSPEVHRLLCAISERIDRALFE